MTLRTIVRVLPILAFGAGLGACQTLAAPKAEPDKAAAAAAYMAKNAKTKGVVTLPPLQYQVLKSGPADGPHPKRSDEITVHYEGKLLNGEVFDSSFAKGEPVTFPLGRLIPGWVVGIQLMRPGDEWVFYVPPQMAYGFKDTGPIPAGSVLVFRVQLIDIKPPKDAPAG